MAMRTDAFGMAAEGATLAAPNKIEYAEWVMGCAVKRWDACSRWTVRVTACWRTSFFSAKSQCGALDKCRNPGHSPHKTKHL